MYKIASSFLCFLFLSVGLLPRAVLADDSPHRIFILHSYEKDHVCGKPQSLGVQRALLKAGFGADDIEIKSYAMDSKRTNNTPELLAQQADIALGMIREFKPHILVTLDDNAFRTVALPLVDSDIQIVFSGMNNIPERYNQQAQWLDSWQAPGKNITGVYEKIHFSTAVKIQKNIQPEMEKLLIVSDNSPTGKALIRQVKAEMAVTPLPVKHEIFITDSWEEYQKRIMAANQDDSDAIYPIALLLKDAQGSSYTASEVLTWTGEHSVKPTLPLNFAFVKLGLLGGAGVDFEAMGYQAGEQVVKILRGENAANIPLEEAQRYALVFNLDRAGKLGIDIPSDILMAADDVYR